MRVLIVDDDPLVRRFIRELLLDLATEIDECADGDEVLAHFEVFRPQWVLMDVEMARLDGIGATERLRAAHPEARIVIVSNHDQPELRRAARAAGACGYVSKRDLLELREVLAAGMTR